MMEVDTNDLMEEGQPTVPLSTPLGESVVSNLVSSSLSSPSLFPTASEAAKEASVVITNFFHSKIKSTEELLKTCYKIQSILQFPCKRSSDVD